MQNTDRPTRRAGFRLRFHPRVLGTPAPVFPGFEIDICDRVDDTARPDAVWHRQRARAMLQTHPEIRELFGHTSITAFWCLLFAGAQLVLAASASWMSVWLLVVVAWVFGAWINMNLFTLAHECNHNLVFKRTSWNRWLFTLTSLPMLLSGHHTWWIEHHVHHNDLGARKDFIKRRRSFLLLTRVLTPMVVPFSLFMLVTQLGRAAFGLFVYVISALRGHLNPDDKAMAILADEHLISGYDRYKLRHWAVWYPLLSLVMVGTLVWLGGWKPLLYLLLAQAFMTGFLHPVMFGLILNNSHFHGHRRYQPSSSYYGWMNWITFNFGLHTEHHDFASIPWSRLPQLRKIAPEYYDTLAPTPSYAGLALQFVLADHHSFSELFDNEVQRNLAQEGRVETDGTATQILGDQPQPDSPPGNLAPVEHSLPPQAADQPGG